jgi:hypothetical protein
MSGVGTTIVLAIHHENMFFTEHVIRHFQRHTDNSVNLLLVVNDETSDDILDLVDFLAQHPRTSVHMSDGTTDRPIGTSIDHALNSSFPFRERLLFTHTDLVYLEPGFWTTEELAGDVKMLSGRFVQEPLWYDSHTQPIPRPADDHLLIDTEFYFSNKLVFRSFDRVELALPQAPWLADALPRFRKATGEGINSDYPLDPFNLSHLKLAYDFGDRVGKLWAYHFPRQCHVNSVLRVFRGQVRRKTVDGKRHLYLPRNILTENSGYQWRTILRYSIMSSYLFNTAADYVIPVAALLKERPNDVIKAWNELQPALRLFFGLADPMPYRIQAADDDPNFILHWK